MAMVPVHRTVTRFAVTTSPLPVCSRPREITNGIKGKTAVTVRYHDRYHTVMQFNNVGDDDGDIMTVAQPNYQGPSDAAPAC